MPIEFGGDLLIEVRCNNATNNFNILLTKKKFGNCFLKLDSNKKTFISKHQTFPQISAHNFIWQTSLKLKALLV